MKSEPNLWEGPNGRLFYKGYPEGDFIRQVSQIHVTHLLDNQPLFALFYVAQYCDAHLEQSPVLSRKLRANAGLHGRD